MYEYTSITNKEDLQLSKYARKLEKIESGNRSNADGSGTDDHHVLPGFGGTYGQKLLSVALCDCLRKEIKSECTMEEIKRWHWIF